MQKAIQYRRYRREDVGAMVRLDLACFTEPFRFDTNSMRTFAEAEDAIVFLAEERGSAELAGFVILQLDWSGHERFGYLVTIDVAPSGRQMGVGAALLLKAERLAQAAGAIRVDLHVAVSNTGAIRFYERQHYERVGTEAGFYTGAGLDAYVYTKSLPHFDRTP